MEEKFQLLKVRSFSDVINDTISFIKRYIKQMGYAVLILVMPLYIIGSFFQSTSLSSAFNLGRGANMVDWQKLAGGNLIGALFLIVGNTLLSLILISTFLKVEQSETGEIESKDIFDGIKEYLGRMLGFYFLVFFAVIVISGLLFLIMAALISISAWGVLVLLGIAMVVGLVYLGISLSFVSIIYMRETIGIGEAVTRSFYLIRQNFWWTFLILMVSWIIGGFAGYIFRVPYTVIVMVKALTTVTRGHSSYDVGVLDRVALALANLGNILTVVIITITSLMQYYSLVEKKDGLSLQEQIDSIGKEEDLPN